MKLESVIDYILERLCKLEAELVKLQHCAVKSKVKIASIEKEIEGKQ